MQPGLVADYMAADLEAILFSGNAVFPPAPVANQNSIAGIYGPDEIVAVDGGPLVLRTQDKAAMISLRFPNRNPLQDETANELVRAVFAGDLAAFRKATHASDGFVKRVEEEAAALTKAYGKATAVKTIGQRTFIFEGEPEIHSYVRVDFERGADVLRVIHAGSGTLHFDRLNMPPGIEMVLAPAGPGRWTTWDFKLGTGAIISQESGRLVIQGQ
jgi:hypothetical protein